MIEYTGVLMIEYTGVSMIEYIGVSMNEYTVVSMNEYTGFSMLEYKDKCIFLWITVLNIYLIISTVLGSRFGSTFAWRSYEFSPYIRN